MSQREAEGSGNSGIATDPGKGELNLREFIRFRGRNGVHVLFQGKAEEYDQYFLGAFQLNPQDDRILLDDLESLAANEKRILGKVDWDEALQKDELYVALAQARQDLTPSRLKDSKQVQNKLKRFLSRGDSLDKLWESIESESLDEFRALLKEFLRGEVFPGTHLQLAVQVRPLRQLDETEGRNGSERAGATNGTSPAPKVNPEEESSEEEEEESSGPSVLTVQPHYDPTNGVKIGRLEPGDQFDVRVVEPSLERLDPSLLKGESPEEAEESIPINATLLEERDATLHSVKQYKVRLEPGIQGEFSVDPSSRVYFRAFEDVTPAVEIRERIRAILITCLIFMFSASMAVFFFPKPVVSLLEKLQASF